MSSFDESSFGGPVQLQQWRTALLQPTSNETDFPVKNFDDFSTFPFFGYVEVFLEAFIVIGQNSANTIQAQYWTEEDTPQEVKIPLFKDLSGFTDAPFSLKSHFVLPEKGGTALIIQTWADIQPMYSITYRYLQDIRGTTRQ